MAQILARAGLHISKTTIERFRKEPEQPANLQKISPLVQDTKTHGRTINAKFPNHTWGVDLQAVQHRAGHSSIETTRKYYLSVQESDLCDARSVQDLVLAKLTNF